MRILGEGVEGSSLLSPFVDRQAKNTDLASKQQWEAGTLDWLSDALFFCLFVCFFHSYHGAGVFFPRAAGGLLCLLG